MMSRRGSLEVKYFFGDDTRIHMPWPQSFTRGNACEADDESVEEIGVESEPGYSECDLASGFLGMVTLGAKGFEWQQ